MKRPRRVVPPASPATVVVLTQRERARAAVRQVFPRRVARVLIVKSSRDLQASFKRQLVDAAIVDLGTPNEDTPHAITLAREFPSAPFVGFTSFRATDASVVARCAASDFADVALEGIDDAAFRDIVLRRCFTWRFAAALSTPPPRLQLRSTLQAQAWAAVIAQGGRPVRTDTIALAVGVTREHLSRAFAEADGPNIKRVIDLVRLLAAAELSKNPGYDVGDVANVLEFASSSHLSTTSQRVVGTRPLSLSRLRSVDLIERFIQGRGRSRSQRRRHPSH